MKLASYELKGGQGSFGIVDGDAVIDLATPEVTSLRAALAAWSRVEFDAQRARGRRLQASDIARWLPPVTDPEKIICVGLNYRLHAEEANMAIPTKPSLFVRFPSSQVGHREPTLMPVHSEQYDYEAELAVIIGQGGRDIAVDDALKAVAGYACFAENSVRDFQRHAAQATPGKNFEASGAFGPWMTTADEVGDPQSLAIIGRVNGQELQHSHTGDMIFTVAELIAYISSFTRLQPGDVIVTGTPEGVGFTRKPPLYLKPGDVFEVEIARVGVLSNPVRAAR